MTDLKPCPFCGNIHDEEFAFENVPSAFGDDFIRVCCSCGATGPLGEVKEEAITRWNKRVIEEQK